MVEMLRRGNLNDSSTGSGKENVAVAERTSSRAWVSVDGSGRGYAYLVLGANGQ